MLKKYKIDLRLNSYVTAEELEPDHYDSIVLASGIKPRQLDIPGIDGPTVFTYEEAFQSLDKIGQRVIIIGAGGIGYDMAQSLTHQDNDAGPIEAFNSNWGIDPEGLQSGGLDSTAKPIKKGIREVTMLQRKTGKFGRSLGKTTGWIHQAELQKRGVKLLGDLSYLKVDDAGLHIEKEGIAQLLAADSIIVCAGQESRDDLADSLSNITKNLYRIGGVKEVRELDAAQAIRDATKLAYSLSTR